MAETFRTDIYKQPPQENPLDALTKLGHAASGLGDIAAGQAVQGAAGADGQIDENKLQQLLTRSPVGAMKAIPTLTALQHLKQQGFATDQAGLETFQKRMALVSHLFSGVASKDNPTINDIYDIASMVIGGNGKLTEEARKHGITLPTVMNVLKQFRKPDGQPLSGPEIRKKALEIQTQAAGTAEVLSQHSPQVDRIDRGGNIEYVPSGTKANPTAGIVVPKNLGPDTVVATPKGPRYLGEQPPPPPSAVIPGQTPRVPVTPSPTGPASGNEPGFNEAEGATAIESARMGNTLSAAADEVPTQKAILGNMERALDSFTSGPGADWTKVAKSAINRNLPLPKTWKFDPQSIADQESFTKQAGLIAQSQFKALGGTGTDHQLGATMATSPNEVLSDMGNREIMAMLKGAADAILVKNSEWQKYKEVHGSKSYQEFTEKFNRQYDPRAFQFKYLKSEERQKYLDKMPKEARDDLLHAITYARQRGWINYSGRVTPEIVVNPARTE